MPSSTTTELPIDIVDATVDDRNFIRDSWLKSYRDSVWVAGIASPLYYRVHGAKIDQIFETSNTMVLVAHYKKDFDQIYGWITAQAYPSQIIAHYAYVKSAFRKMGIGRALFSAITNNDLAGRELIATHRTWAHIWIDGKLKIAYNPYLI